MDIGTWILISLVSIGLIIGYCKSLIKKNGKDIIEKKLAASRLNISEKLIGEDGESAIAFDQSSKKLFLITFDWQHQKARIESVLPSDILAVAVLENGSTLTETCRMSQIGNALLGNALAGGLGAVIGGLSGTQHNIAKSLRIDLRITINDTQAPHHLVNCMDFGSSGINKSSVLYRNIMENARHWHDLITVLIRDADRKDGETKYAAVVPNREDTLGVADEIGKLVSLMEKGHISKEEFAAQKLRLLSK